MRVTVRLFARLRDLAGTGELIREVPSSSTAQAGLERSASWSGRDFASTRRRSLLRSTRNTRG